MRKYIIPIFLTFLSLVCRSQEYSFSLYFEDSLGNKDTLNFGFDQSATFGIDEKFGEINFIEDPYNSTFFPFFTDAVAQDDSDCRLEREKTPTYITKKQYINQWNNPFIEIGLNAKNWPVKISWEQASFADFDIDHYLGSKDLGLVLTSFHPFNGYPDAFCCGSWPTPSGLTWLADTTDIQIEKNSCCLYKANFSTDSTSLIYVGQLYKYTSAKNFQTEKYSCWYNDFLDAICIQNINGLVPSTFEVFNSWGLKVIDEQISSKNGTQINFNINHLAKGLYIARISPVKNNTLNYTFKIIKK